MKYKAVFGLLLLLAIAGCKKEDNDSGTPQQPQQYGSVRFTVSYKSGDKALVYDTIHYQNASGNKYSVTRLQYYLSGFRFLNNQGGSIHRSNEYSYQDAATSGNSFVVDSVPVGSYVSLTFNVGLSPELNVSYSLPAVIENVNMAWPEVMGGGYHFMKLEGHYISSNSSEKGFTMHIGTDPMLVNQHVLPVTLEVSNGTTAELNIQMDINEWFTHPYDYDFNRDGNYTMGDSTLMKIVRENGKDVFKVL